MSTRPESFDYELKRLRQAIKRINIIADSKIFENLPDYAELSSITDIVVGVGISLTVDTHTQVPSMIALFRDRGLKHISKDHQVRVTYGGSVEVTMYLEQEEDERVYIELQFYSQGDNCRWITTDESSKEIVQRVKTKKVFVCNGKIVSERYETEDKVLEENAHV